MKKFDVIAFGTGSASNIYAELLAHNRNIRIAIIENGPVGGICLTRGCIPSKMLLYPAEIVHSIKRAKDFWIDAQVSSVDFERIMSWAHDEVMGESYQIENALMSDPRVTLYRTTGEFVGEYQVKVGDEIITGDKILLCTGSRPFIPNIPGLQEAGFYTNENFFTMRKLPKRTAVIGGSFVGLEFGFFLSMMGSDVYVFEMLDRIAYQEEPEISYQLESDLDDHMHILPRSKVVEVKKVGEKKMVVAEDLDGGGTFEVEADEIVVAAGRQSNSDITKPERTGVKTDEKGWIIVNEYMETTKPNIWACGDAIGKHMFKHAANYESMIVYYNAFKGRRLKADFHAVPHAIFTQPEVGAVGSRESEVKSEYLVGFYLYKDTAKGLAMKDEEHFAKVIVDRENGRVLGGHIIGPYASSMIHEVILLMNAGDQSFYPVYEMMHVHPAVNEVVERAFGSLAEPAYWDDLKDEVRRRAVEKREQKKSKALRGLL
ncbi:MAG: dihydrolipoyl dehydrogenase [Nitrososphaeria archaeon]